MALTVGSVVDGKVTGVMKFGAFVALPEGKSGLVHISEISYQYVESVADHLQKDQEVKVKILSIGEDGKISLSIKKAMPAPKEEHKRTPATRGKQDHKAPGVFERRQRDEDLSFDDMLSRFLKDSQERNAQGNADKKRRSVKNARQLMKINRSRLD